MRGDSVQTIDRWGHFVLQGYSGFNSLGERTVQAVFPGDDAYFPCGSPLLTLRVLETAGYAVIVQRKHAGGEGLESQLDLLRLFPATPATGRQGMGMEKAATIFPDHPQTAS